MRKMLAIGMLGIFLLAVAAVQPVTASHQKSFVNKIPSSKELAEKKELAKKILKDPKILKEMMYKRVISTLILQLVQLKHMNFLKKLLIRQEEIKSQLKKQVKPNQCSLQICLMRLEHL